MKEQNCELLGQWREASCHMTPTGSRMYPLTVLNAGKLWRVPGNTLSVLLCTHDHTQDSVKTRRLFQRGMFSLSRTRVILHKRQLLTDNHKQHKKNNSFN